MSSLCRKASYKKTISFLYTFVSYGTTMSLSIHIIGHYKLKNEEEDKVSPQERNIYPLAQHMF